LHSNATEGKKDKNWAKKVNFLANGESLNDLGNCKIGKGSGILKFRK